MADTKNKNAIPLEPGFYWAKVYDEWQPVKLGKWTEVSAIGWDEDCDAVTEWGPRITAPSTAADPDGAVKLSPEHPIAPGPVSRDWREA